LRQQNKRSDHGMPAGIAQQSNCPEENRFLG